MGTHLKSLSKKLLMSTDDMSSSRIKRIIIIIIIIIIVGVGMGLNKYLIWS